MVLEDLGRVMAETWTATTACSPTSGTEICY